MGGVFIQMMKIDFPLMISMFLNLSKLLQGISKASTEIHIEEVKIALHEGILDLQSKLSLAYADYEGILKLNEELRQKLTNKEKWEQEKTRYRLTNVGSGVVVYVLNEPAKGIEPPHWLCPNCYEQEQKSILQRQEKQRTYGCPFCKNSFLSSEFPESPRL